MAHAVSFKRGVSENIGSVTSVDGQLLFTTDKGHIYLDDGTKRIEFYAADLKTLTDAIALLNGTADKGGSVANKITASETKLIGTETDAKTANTINGARNYAKDVEGKLKTVATSGKAADVTIEDTNNNFEGTNVEDALKEVVTSRAVTMETSGESGNTLKSYTLKQGNNTIGTIDIPKDFMVQSGEIVNSRPTTEGGTQSGTFIKLTLSNGDVLYIDVATLIEYVTSGSGENDIVQISINESHEVSATIKDASITKTQLDAGVKMSLGLADSAVQPNELAVTTEDNEYLAGITVDGSGNIGYTKKSFSNIPVLQWGDFSATGGAGEQPTA